MCSITLRYQLNAISKTEDDSIDITTYYPANDFDPKAFKETGHQSSMGSMKKSMKECQ